MAVGWAVAGPGGLTMHRSVVVRPPPPLTVEPLTPRTTTAPLAGQVRRPAAHSPCEHPPLVRHRAASWVFGHACAWVACAGVLVCMYALPAHACLRVFSHAALCVCAHLCAFDALGDCLSPNQRLPVCYLPCVPVTYLQRVVPACVCFCVRLVRVWVCAHVCLCVLFARRLCVCLHLCASPMRMFASVCVGCTGRLPVPQSAPNACVFPAVCVPVTYRLQCTAGGGRGAPTPSGGACTRQSGCTCAACAGAEEALTAPGIIQGFFSTIHHRAGL